MSSYRRAPLAFSLALCLTTSATAQTIGSLSSSTLPQAGRLVITGSGFGSRQGTGNVTIGGATAPVSLWSDSEITAYVSDSSPLAVDNVQAVTPAGASNTVPLTVTARQSSGQVLWRFQADGLYIQGRPGMGPDGTVYPLDVAGHLYALTPSGGVKWIFSVAPNEAFESVDVGADGTVYFAAENTVYAVASDGTEKWTVSDPTGATVSAGPNVGPDGNIYAVTAGPSSGAALGAMTISPAGEILSHTPGFSIGLGLDLLTEEIVFGPPNQFYFVLDNAATGEALQYLQLGGDFLFSRAAGSLNQQLSVDLKGRIYAGGGQSNQLLVFDPAGGLLRGASFGITGNTVISAPSPGSDGTLYLTQNFAPTQLLALDADLTTKWAFPNSGILGSPQVNPANTLVAVGSYVVGGPGMVQAVDAASGRLAWRVPLPTDPEGFVWPMSGPRFSADGSVVYMGMDVSHNENNPYTYFYAFAASAASSPNISLSPSSLSFGSETVGGASKPHVVTVTNTGIAPLTISAIAASGDFAQKNNCGSTLQPGTSCAIGVVFRPRSQGPLAGKITVTGDAPDSPRTVRLSGTGL
jgi:outer membrane protein assembly factor BamB